MKYLRLTSYFLHLLFNWGGKVAARILLHETRGEKKYRINTTGFLPLSKLHIKGKDLENATEYMPVDYPLLETLLVFLPPTSKNGIFIDIGCGKGRALCVAAHFGFRKAEGIDFAKELVEEAQNNLHSTQKIVPDFKARILWTDLESYTFPRETSCIFLFNPFNETLVTKLVAKIKETDFLFPVHILYASPMHVAVFEKNGFQILKEIEVMKPVKGAILYRPKAS